jgi:CelD/BcsL family acetyltransferase involved in cellulose biosynthesis
VNLQVKIFNSFCSELKAHWLIAEKNFGICVFQTYDWCEIWYNNVGKNQVSLHILVLTEDDQLKAIFPLCIKNNFLLNVISLPGDNLADYQAPLMKKYSEFELIWEYLKPYCPKYDLFLLNRLPEPLSKIKLNSKKFVQYETFQNSEILLPTKVIELNNCISKRKLKDVRRYIRRLNDIGDVSFNINKSIGSTNDVVNFVIKQKKIQYNRTGVRNIFLNQNIEKFYNELEKINIEKSGVKINLSELRVDGEIISAHIGLVYKNKFYYLMPAYSEGKFSKYSPGSILLYNLITWSIENNIEVFDLTLGNEGYKNSWTNNQMFIQTVRIANSNTGLVMLYIISIIGALKHNIYSRYFLTKCLKLIRLFGLGKFL